MNEARIDLLAHRGAPWLGAALVAAALPGAWLAPRVFFAAWLAGCWFVAGIVLGAVSWQLVHRLTGGLWGEALAPHVRRVARRMPRVVVLFLVPVLLGGSLLWGPSRVFDTSAEHAFLRAWQTPAFVTVRCLGYALVWLALGWLARRNASKGQAAAALLAHLVVTSLAAVDGIGALVPHWSSSGFALSVLAGQSYGGAALVIGMACATLAGPQPRSEGVPLTRDLGNVLLTATMLWAYLVFMPFLIVWAENLPREISWYVPRLQTGWLGVGVALVVVHFALPFVALLFRALKDSPRRLAWLAALMLAAHGLDAAWLVVPSVAPTDLAAWWLAPLLVAGLGLVAFGGADLALPTTLAGWRMPRTADAEA